MDWMDRPRTSIDERMLSGRLAVVIMRLVVAGFWSSFIDLLLLVAATFCILGLDFCVLAYWALLHCWFPSNLSTTTQGAIVKLH